MTKIHNLGFPRIGEKRELKFALERYWRGELAQAELLQTGAALRQQHWQDQTGLDLLPVGDFSFYDQILDASFLLGNIPQRVKQLEGSELDNYFRIARGRSAADSGCNCVHAGEMTKWFDTNYHYIVPEFSHQTRFSLNPERLFTQIDEAQRLGHQIKPVIVGPVTYLKQGKAKDDIAPLALLEQLLPVYVQLLEQLAERGIEWVQIDEPILVTELDTDWQQALTTAYQALSHARVKLLLTTYFGALEENLALACSLPVSGLHLDAIAARHEIERVVQALPDDTVLSLGVINGRNIWKTDLNSTLDWLEPIAAKLKQRLWLAPSCSLLHVPVDLDSEAILDPELISWLAFARQKLDELSVLAQAINHGRTSVIKQLASNQHAISSRASSSRVAKPHIKAAVNRIDVAAGQRDSDYAKRAQLQQQQLQLPPFPTTTIGSFPQTAEIRKARLQWRRGELDCDTYTQLMQAQIQEVVRQQEVLDLDVLVHGEAERNDMVEYFGEQLEGFAFSQFGWVQSYGSRCVKPPILFGDIDRTAPMTLEWINYAQSLTKKPMKGMLTGPVTILNWSFVRDDQPLSVTCNQIALAIRQEVLDLEASGVEIIQIDEAALREGLPLRRSQWQEYLSWAIEAFRIAANGVSDYTQIHTHMCYSDFNEIIDAIAAMDADVITIETSRSDMHLLDAFDRFNYPNQIGPGVYDIHSPNTPSTEQMVDLMQQAVKRIPAERLWVNPDCGLKTRQWSEVVPALVNMVDAAKALRLQFAG